MEPPLVKVFDSLPDYLRGTTIADSGALGWRSLKVYLASDASNCIRISRLQRNAIKITLTGTACHCTQIGDLRDSRPTKAREVLLLPAGSSIESYWRTTGAIEEMIFIEFDDDLFEVYCPEILINSAPRVQLSATGYSDRVEISTLARMLSRELDPSTRRGPRFAEMTIRLLAAEIAHSDWYRSGVENGKGSDVRSRIAKAINLINDNFASDISVADLAEETGLSMSQLFALFKQRTGKAPYAYLIDRRIERAASLLGTTSRPIAEIAMECGFLDQSQMTRTFKKRLGVTPRACRLQAVCKNAR